MAKLPEKRRLFQVKDIGIGKIAYVSAYAMKVAVDKECYLRTDYTVHTKHSSDTPLKIQRTINGFIAFIFETDYLWPISDDIDTTVNIEESNYAHVVGFGDKLDYEKLSLKELKEALSSVEDDGDYEEAAKIRDLIQSKNK